MQGVAGSQDTGRGLKSNRTGAGDTLAYLNNCDTTVATERLPELITCDGRSTVGEDDLFVLNCGGNPSF